MTINKSIAAITMAALLGACATTAPAQLVEARDAYETSSRGLAGKLTPTDVYDAKKALDKANKEFADNGDSPTCRDYAYIAHRKLALADAKARTELDRQRIAEAVKAGVVVRDVQVKNTKEALDTTREQLKDERRNVATDQLRAANAAQGKELDAEKAAHASAEGKLAGAMQDLAAVAAIREEPRGVVITLSGGVLFASGSAVLLNTAMTKLDQVAEALKAQDDDKRIMVEGHTDSRGSDNSNQQLSVNRANAVRDYLVSRGVDADRITATGMGANNPIADNKTAENRANNRRVEIIIGSSKVSARKGPPVSR